MSSRLATSMRWALLANASTPPAVRPFPATSGLPTLRVLAVARTLLLLPLPVVADLLEGVLERGERDPVRGLTIAVLLLGGLERLDVGVLRLLRRPRQGGRQPLSLLLVECHSGTRTHPGTDHVQAIARCCSAGCRTCRRAGHQHRRDRDAEGPSACRSSRVGPDPFVGLLRPRRDPASPGSRRDPAGVSTRQASVAAPRAIASARWSRSTSRLSATASSSAITASRSVDS